ncbi:MAG TPA: DUF4097 family beta strand repeat-containing protein [Pseudonocardiaceae bacterium]|jgi:hypothetical protein|nr:DUF4097 family beta strand repeat-containing protein [Pseudonocardiaceae bacterium]
MSESEFTGQQPESEPQGHERAQGHQSGAANPTASAETEEPEVIIEADIVDDAENPGVGRSFEEAAEEELSDSDRNSQQQTFPVTGPLEIEVHIGSGRIAIDLVDEPLATVEIRHEPGSENPWLQSISSLVEWVNGRFGDQRAAATEEMAKAAVDETRIDLIGQRLVVTGPKGRLRMIPLSVVVRAPSGSQVNVHGGSAGVTVTGAAGRCEVETGSGDIALDRADGYATIATGSGALRLGPMLGGLKARSGSGEIEVSSVGGPTTVSTGSGDVWFGAVQDNVTAKTGSGDLTIADGACGDIELTTSSGEIRVGVRPGTKAMIDLASGSGQARSELDVHDAPMAGAPTLRLRGRTSSGNAVVTSAVG